MKCKTVYQQKMRLIDILNKHMNTIEALQNKTIWDKQKSIMNLFTVVRST